MEDDGWPGSFPPTAPPDAGDTELDKIGQRLVAGHDRAEHGDQEWIEGSLEMASALADGRDRFPSDAEFGKWILVHGHNFLNKNDRVALIGLGRNIRTARAVLKETKSRSYQIIWNEARGLFPSARKETKSVEADKEAKASVEADKEAKASVEADKEAKASVEADEDAKASAQAKERAQEIENEQLDNVEKNANFMPPEEPPAAPISANPTMAAKPDKQLSGVIVPTEKEAKEHQENLYAQACRLLESMTDETRQKFQAHVASTAKPAAPTKASASASDPDPYSAASLSKLTAQERDRTITNLKLKISELPKYLIDAITKKTGIFLKDQQLNDFAATLKSSGNNTKH